MSSTKDTSWIHTTLRSWIISKKLEPGEKLIQLRIADELKVSRTPVVKALHKLASEGLVDNIPQRGFFVHHLTIKELYELFILRESLEKIVIRDVAQNIKKNDLIKINSIFREFKPNKNIDSSKYRIKDQQFHQLFFDICTNTLAKNINDSYQVLNKTFLSGLVRPPEETLKEHRTIIDAIKKGDVQGASRAISVHDNKSTHRILNIINGMNSLGIDPSKTKIGNINFGLNELKK